ncbi:uncharacterized protein B0H18DRAFT_986712 [Fomitopsis serialis]|uniref:uncharacterized protein n=1 Tax=Fomitopsis serialis TaxID=139415 RepID=UPI0020078174|nr:uncharacterized protein B0H18DRAFT_986712 [Neoantrodia serialis]KAH9932624.1 hypothetical protein B0H18DRAFT_986712 [Neoantrodia serialis]
MTTIVEVAVVDLKEGIDKENAVLEKLREGAAKGGLKRQSYGLSVEHPQRLYWTLYFENGFEQKDFKWPEAEYGNFVDDIKSVSAPDSTYTRRYFTFPSFPHAVTAAPVTEVAIITLKADADLAAFKAVQEGALGKLTQAPTVHGATYSITTDAGANPVVLLLVGWDSVEAHQSLVAIPENKAALGSLYGFIEKADILHVSYSNKTY